MCNEPLFVHMCDEACCQTAVSHISQMWRITIKTLFTEKNATARTVSSKGSLELCIGPQTYRQVELGAPAGVSLADKIYVRAERATVPYIHRCGVWMQERLTSAARNWRVSASDDL